MNEELNIDNIDFDTITNDKSLGKSDLNENNIIKEKSISCTLSTSKSKLSVKKRCIKENTYFWEPIEEAWQSKLGSNKFMIKNCLGDLEFNSIESALTNAGYKTTRERLRKRLVKYIMSMEPKMFIEIIKSYQIEVKNGEFVGKWDPMSIRNKRDFINIIKSPGFGFQGESDLKLISKAIGIDIIIFNNSEEKNIINLSNSKNLQDKIIVLYYTSDSGQGTRETETGHYQTVGLKGKGESIKTLFLRSKLPEEINRILDKTLLISFHVNDICKSGICGTSKLHLNYILNTIQSRLKTITKSDRLAIMKMIQNII